MDLKQTSINRRYLALSGLGIGALAAWPWAKTIFAKSSLVKGQYLDLPKGFRAKLIDQAGRKMNDGYKVPGQPDGMACFLGTEGTWILMRNHELSASHTEKGPYTNRQSPSPAAYDPKELGGVSRLVIRSQDLSVSSSNMVLMGTTRNCAGGVSPWGWLSCEETFSANGATKHGYVFLCSPKSKKATMSQPITAYGRFNHEAAVVDPKSNMAYLTEDRMDSCLYRFLPNKISEPFTGKLQALAYSDKSFDPNKLELNHARACKWVDLPPVDENKDELRHVAQKLGAIAFARGEGLWREKRQIFFSATAGGPNQKGQIWKFIPSDKSQQHGFLQLLAQSENEESLDMPDNITVGPRGSVFIAEDGGGEQFIRILNPNGQLTSFARNAVSNSEFTGVCFSPDLSTLFVNIQTDGLTLAVQGPFINYC